MFYTFFFHIYFSPKVETLQEEVKPDSLIIVYKATGFHEPLYYTKISVTISIKVLHYHGSHWQHWTRRKEILGFVAQLHSRGRQVDSLSPVGSCFPGLFKQKHSVSLYVWGKAWHPDILLKCQDIRFDPKQGQ